MDRHRVSAIAHATHAYCNPVSATKLESLFPLLGLEPAPGPARVVDFGCGKAEWIIRLAEQFGARADGVDRSALMLTEGRERARARGVAHLVRLYETDARSFASPEPEAPYDLAVAIGATHAFGTFPELLAALRDRVRPGGRVLVGEAFWRKKPDPAYLAAFGGAEGDYGSHADNVARGEQAGLVPLHAVTASEDEWDEYEWRYTRTFEQYARAHPGEPGVAEALERMLAWRRAYLAWGRETLGFGVYLFERA